MFRGLFSLYIYVGAYLKNATPTWRTARTSVHANRRMSPGVVSISTMDKRVFLGSRLRRGDCLAFVQCVEELCIFKDFGDFFFSRGSLFRGVD